MAYKFKIGQTVRYRGRLYDFCGTNGATNSFMLVDPPAIIKGYDHSFHKYLLTTLHRNINFFSEAKFLVEPKDYMYEQSSLKGAIIKRSYNL